MPDQPKDPQRLEALDHALDSLELFREAIEELGVDTVDLDRLAKKLKVARFGASHGFDNRRQILSQPTASKSVDTCTLLDIAAPKA